MQNKTKQQNKIIKTQPNPCTKGAKQDKHPTSLQKCMPGGSEGGTLKMLEVKKKSFKNLFCMWVHLGLNSEPCACYASVLPCQLRILF
jgi:hypothetical protein